MIWKPCPSYSSVTSMIPIASYFHRSVAVGAIFVVSDAEPLAAGFDVLDWILVAFDLDSTVSQDSNGDLHFIHRQCAVYTYRRASRGEPRRPRVLAIAIGDFTSQAYGAFEDCRQVDWNPISCRRRHCAEALQIELVIFTGNLSEFAAVRTTIRTI